MTDLNSRYGSRSRPRWFWPVVAAVGIAMGVAFAAWVGFQDKPVTARVYGYDVKSAHLTTIKLDIGRTKPVALTCTVYAQAYDHSIVGEKTVAVPAAKARKTRVTIDIQTERLAVTAVLRACQQTG